MMDLDLWYAADTLWIHKKGSIGWRKGGHFPNGTQRERAISNPIHITEIELTRPGENRSRAALNLRSDRKPWSRNRRIARAASSRQKCRISSKAYPSRIPRSAVIDRTNDSTVNHIPELHSQAHPTKSTESRARWNDRYPEVENRYSRRAGTWSEKRTSAEKVLRLECVTRRRTESSVGSCCKLLAILPPVRRDPPLLGSAVHAPGLLLLYALRRRDPPSCSFTFFPSLNYPSNLLFFTIGPREGKKSNVFSY